MKQASFNISKISQDPGRSFPRNPQPQGLWLQSRGWGKGALALRGPFLPKPSSIRVHHPCHSVCLLLTLGFIDGLSESLGPRQPEKRPAPCTILFQLPGPRTQNGTGLAPRDLSVSTYLFQRRILPLENSTKKDLYF